VSYSLAISDGDLVQQGSQLGLVFGINKLKQDVNLWMLEQYRGDRFHVSYGSILQDFIGGIANKASEAEIYGEVLRVLQNYQLAQSRRFKENPELFSASELLVQVDDVSTTLDYDTVTVTIKLRNGSQQYTTIRVVKTT
jgi:hypothetical protein